MQGSEKEAKINITEFDVFSGDFVFVVNFFFSYLLLSTQINWILAFRCLILNKILKYCPLVSLVTWWLTCLEGYLAVLRAC